MKVISVERGRVIEAEELRIKKASVEL